MKEPTTPCLVCDRPATYGRRYVLESTDGPVEHASVHCKFGHHFNLPVAMIAATKRKETDGTG